ncbi:MAG: hypothetical protein E7604_03990 [Ruminococcaceae bacterium]|nr:hypothetical protein [Oscillospiraceae bacterium]
MRTFDPEQFIEVKDAVLSTEREQKGIGTLGEKSLHRILKTYYEPLTALHEQKLGRYVADILNEDGVIEVQTRSLSVMRKKLEAFLEVTHVTVVHPVVHNKWVAWVDPETGEATKHRKSPKTGTLYDAFWELGGIPDLLLHPNLTLCLVMLDMEELRFLDGWGNGGKRGSSRCDRFPRALLSETFLSSRSDYAVFLPDSLPDVFTRRELASAANVRCDRRGVDALIRVLKATNVLSDAGMRGREKLYQRTDECKQIDQK